MDAIDASSFVPVTNVDAFVLKQLELLQQEKNEEYEQNRVLRERLSPKLLQKQGICLLSLRVAERCSSLYGRLIVTFEPASPFKKELPAHRLSTGDIVGIYPSQKSWNMPSLASGIVTRSTPMTISIAVDVVDDKDTVWADDEQFLLLKLANDVTYNRLKAGLNRLRTYTSGSASDLIAVLFGERLPSPYVQVAQTEVIFFNNALDDSQKEAVQFALSRKEVAIVHGPPGTGKTTTVIEIIMQAVHRGLKILACAPSNIAVDGLVERLSDAGHHRVVRLGHPARVLPAVQKYSLDAVLSSSDGARIVEDVRREIDMTLNKLKKTRDKGERHQTQSLLKSLRKELRERSDKAIKDILGNAQVVLATLTSATETGPLKILDDQHFDLTIIDECSQATEAACWVALLKCGKCVLAGDHKQLPPTVVSKEAAKAGLSRTLMERLLEEHAARSNDVVRMLTMQYRMHELIMRWSSEAFYDGRLTAHASVSQHLLRDLPGVQGDDNTRLPLLLIDTTGCGLFEVDLPEEVSKANEGEADLVAIHVEQLIKAGVKSDEIAVISPYNLQVELLRSRLSEKYPRLEIKSVDGFQGREKEAVVISCVRSNKKGEVGFLAEDRRLNVAVTRARRHVAIVCDVQTISHHTFLQQLAEYFERHGEIRSAHMYSEEGYNIGEESSQAVLDLQKDLADSTSVTDKVPVVRSAIIDKGKKTSKGAKAAKGCIVATSMKVADTASVTVAVEVSAQNPGDNDRRLKLEDIITNFAADANHHEFAFPSELNSFERRLVHEIAERLGLGHQSQGEGPNRHIVLTKSVDSVRVHEPREASRASLSSDRSVHRTSDATGSTAAATVTSSGSKLDVSPAVQPNIGASGSPVRQGAMPSERGTGTIRPTEDAVASVQQSDGFSRTIKSSGIEPRSTDPSTKICSICGSSVPAQNYELHTVRCGTRKPSLPGNLSAATASVAEPGAMANGRQNLDVKHTQAAKSQTKQKHKVPPSGQRVSSAAGRLSAESGDDFDDVMREASRYNAACGFGSSCKTPVLTLGQNCQFCARRFCLTHHMPEVHGCGAAAKAHARQLVSRDGAAYISGGSLARNKKPSAQLRSALENKLAKKIDHLTDQRRPKAKDK